MNAVRVACWPSLGGVWIKQAALAELDFLGLDRWSDTLRRFSINRTEENEFCKKLQKVGAERWHLPPHFEDRQHLGGEQSRWTTLEECFKLDITGDYLIAWTQYEKAACYNPTAKAMENGEKKMLMCHNARDAEDRFHSIMGLGGKWYIGAMPSVQILRVSMEENRGVGRMDVKLHHLELLEHDPVSEGWS